MHFIHRVEGIGQDLRYAVRALRRTAGFTTIAVVSLALGIGANTSIFQLLDAVRLRNLPVDRPEELAEVRIVGGNGGMGLNPGRLDGLDSPSAHVPGGFATVSDGPSPEVAIPNNASATRRPFSGQSGVRGSLGGRRMTHSNQECVTSL